MCVQTATATYEQDKLMVDELLTTKFGDPQIVNEMLRPLLLDAFHNFYSEIDCRTKAGLAKIYGPPY